MSHDFWYYIYLVRKEQLSSVFFSFCLYIMWNYQKNLYTFEFYISITIHRLILGWQLYELSYRPLKKYKAMRAFIVQCLRWYQAGFLKYFLFLCCQAIPWCIEFNYLYCLHDYIFPSHFPGCLWMLDWISEDASTKTALQT